MAFLKEDGSLDVERINKLSIEEYMDVVGNFTKEQREEYYSHSVVNESENSVNTIEIECSIEEDIERNGSVLLDDKLKELKNRLKNQK